MRIGTHHFRDMGSAFNYYLRQGLEHSDVRAKLIADEIAIGPPLIVQVAQGTTVGLDADGRYYIEESPHNTKSPEQICDDAQRRVMQRIKDKHGATRGQLVTRSIKAVGGYPPAKGYRIVGYDYTTPNLTASLVSMRSHYTIRVQVARTGADHLAGKVYTRWIAKGSTFEQALDNAVTKVKQQRAKA